ncbi:MAG: hypothetical protein KC619_14545 [Myxococcales bacterium]|nr:hypothetical protein [Myxococcales bacterium]
MAPRVGPFLVALALAGGCSGPPAPDAGTRPDAGVDASLPDAGPPDAGDDPHCTQGTAEDAPPVFAGVEGARSDGPDAVVLHWRAASDDRTEVGAIRYRVFVAVGDAPLDLGAPAATARGIETVRVSGLAEGTAYRFVVRAEDGSGQRECNAVEATATPTPITGCVDYATWIQPIFDAHCVTCHGAEAPRRGLRLDGLEGVRAGGESGAVVVPCRPDQSLLHAKVTSDAPPQGLRMPRGGPALDSGEQARIRLWIEQGAQAACPIDPSVCADTTPPVFAGITAAEPRGSGVEVCWTDGSDDVSPSGSLRYAVSLATAPGIEPPAWTRWVSEVGAACLTIPGLVPDQTYCFVVRAADEAGNRDANLIERCVTMPSATCVDHAEVVGPLLARECAHCHGGPEPQSGLDLSSYARLMADPRGYVVPCDAASSVLAQKLLERPPFGLRMPADGPPFLTSGEIQTVERWIEGGARERCADPDPCASP